jgi:hypothetical protein
MHAYSLCALFGSPSSAPWRSPRIFFPIRLDIIMLYTHRYLFQGNGGDQITGRVLSGLSFHGREFATLPPHLEMDHLQKLTQSNWCTIIPSYASLPASFKQTLPFLLASLLYHEQWIKTTLPSSHPIHSSVLFSSPLIHELDLRGKVLTGEDYCTRSHIRATGIPPHLCIVNQIVESSRQSFTQVAEIQSTVSCMSTTLPKQVADHVLSQCDVHGAVAITKDDLSGMLNSVVDQLTSATLNIRASGSTLVINTDSHSGNTQPWMLWTWGEAFHMVPEGWMIPKTHIKEMWFLWHFGHATLKIGPLSKLTPQDVPHQVMQLSRTRKVMDTLIILSEPFRNGQSLKTMTREQHSILFDQAYTEMSRRMGRQNTRAGDVAIGTIYELILKNKSSFK